MLCYVMLCDAFGKSRFAKSQKFIIALMLFSTSSWCKVRHDMGPTIKDEDKNIQCNTSYHSNVCSHPSRWLRVQDTGMLTLEGRAYGSQPLQSRPLWLPWEYVRSHTPPFHHTHGFLGLAGRAERVSCVWCCLEIRWMIVF